MPECALRPFSGGQLNTGGYIQRLRPCYGNSAADIVGRQAAGQHPARAAAMIGQQRPVKGMAGATGKTVRVPFGIEQQPVGNPVPIATDIKIGSAGNADGLDQRQTQPVPDGCSAVRRFAAMQLDIMRSRGRDDSV